MRRDRATNSELMTDFLSEKNLNGDTDSFFGILTAEVLTLGLALGLFSFKFLF